MKGFVKEGEAYDLDYIRDPVEDNHFRYSSTASTELKPRNRVTFDAVE